MAEIRGGTTAIVAASDQGGSSSASSGEVPRRPLEASRGSPACSRIIRWSRGRESSL